MIYIYIRLSSYVEEPERSRIRSELKRIAKFRNMTWPMTTQKSFQIPFLSPMNFKTTKRWIKRFLRARKQLGIVFHLPKCIVREAAHSKVAALLYNPFAWSEYDLSQPEPLPCPCQKILVHHPRLENIEGHICGTL